MQVIGENSLGVKIVHSLRANQSICSASEVAQAVVAAANKQQHGQEEKLALNGLNHQLPPTSSSSPPTSSVLPTPFDPSSTSSSSMLLAGLCTPPEALQACHDLKCSHWNTLIGCRPTTASQAALFNPSHGLQQANRVIGQIDSKIISNLENPNSITTDQFGNQVPNKASGREALLLKQHKLALFNQILAQQLMLLSYQQSQNRLGYSGFHHNDNDLLSQMSSKNNQMSPACDKSINNNNEKQQQRQRVPLNQNTSVPQGVSYGSALLASSHNNNFFNRRQLISANGILFGTENITCNTNAFEKCSSIAYKLMTANSKRNNNARHFNKTFDNPNIESAMYQHQLQYQQQQLSTTSKSKDNEQNDDNEQNSELLATLRDQGSWFSNDSSDNKVIITKYKGEFKVSFLKIYDQ